MAEAGAGAIVSEEPIIRRRLSDEVFLRLKWLISSGELQPGDELPSERELMARFNVGRPAIREALQALSSIGLIAITQGERARVLQLTARSIIRQVDVAARIMLSSSPDALEHLKAARIFFERGMVQEAAANASDNDVAMLRIRVEEQRAFLGSAEKFVSADMRFHAEIAVVSRNPIYIAVSEAMLGWLKEYHTEMLIWTGKEKVTLAEHEEIIEAIAKHDAAAADSAIVRHLERSRALYSLSGNAGAADQAQRSKATA